jgi:hypothetical protein
MTEEMEKKLNELLGLKKQLEEIAADKKESDTTTVFAERSRKTKVYFYIWFAVSIGIMLMGFIGISMNTGKDQIIALFIAVVGFESTVLMKMWYHVIATKLAILQEMKQFELRITEMLKKS